MCLTPPKSPDNAAADYLTEQLSYFRASKDKWAIRAIANKRRYEAAERENAELKRELESLGYRRSSDETDDPNLPSHPDLN